MESATGYILPVEFVGQQWRSSAWPMRGGLITLIPGDSAMGYRLPLNSLPALTEDERVIDRDPFEPREPLPLFALGDAADTPLPGRPYSNKNRRLTAARA